jgi:hypothetical protein
MPTPPSPSPARRPRALTRAVRAALAALLATVAACAETSTMAVPGPPCDESGRAEYCKETCPTETCPDAAQSSCEAECAACAPEVAYCPAPNLP